MVRKEVCARHAALQQDANEEAARSSDVAAGGKRQRGKPDVLIAVRRHFSRPACLPPVLFYAIIFAALQRAMFRGGANPRYVFRFSLIGSAAAICYVIALAPVDAESRF